MTVHGVAVDTSVAVPLVMAAHPAHLHVVATLGDRVPHLSGHALAETYSVLTRLPGDARVAPGDAVRLMDERFGAPLVLSARSAAVVHRRLAAASLAGGATYDGLVALAATEHRITLLTRDERARATYDALGVPVEIIPDA
jgi:predicted nucleic acid-binding protein